MQLTGLNVAGAAGRSTRAEQDDFNMDGFEEISDASEALPALPQPMVYPAYQQVSLLPPRHPSALIHPACLRVCLDPPCLYMGLPWSTHACTRVCLVSPCLYKGLPWSPLLLQELPCCCCCSVSGASPCYALIGQVPCPALSLISC